MEELKYLDSLRFLELSCNEIRKIKELDALIGLASLTKLDLCHNVCQQLKLYRTQVIYKLLQLRELDGVHITSKEIVKAQIFYGHDQEEKRSIFENLLPNEHEQFVDRRLYTCNMIDIESDSEPGDYDFFEKYDEHGEAIEKKPKYLPKGAEYPFNLKESGNKLYPG